MKDVDMMPVIPVSVINTSLNSPKRPTPRFFTEEKTFSTKKERGLTPRSKPYPRPPVKSCPPVSRVFHHSHVDRPRPVSFKSPNSLSISYDQDRQETYFQQGFSIERKLGSGSFGDVYQVRSKDDGKYYAVKRSRERYKGDLDRKRKLEEVSKHELLPEHDNCVRFYKAWEEKQRLYIQTELCETSLANLSYKEHDIPEKLVWSYLIDLLRAVKHLHDYDLVHMDIKPENIFIAKDGTCKLGDFGLMVDLSKPSDLSEAQEGDPKYLAPELMNGKFTKAADVFSLGITILELACDLDLPRGDIGWHQLRSGHLPDDIVKDKISNDLKSIIMLMMEPDYTKRLSAAALLNLPPLKQRSKMYVIEKSLFQKSEILFKPFIITWKYFVQIMFSLWLVLYGSTRSETVDVADSNLNQRADIWESSISDDEVFICNDCQSESIAQRLDFSTDSNESTELAASSMHCLVKPFTTGAKKRITRSARTLLAADSPAKTPSQGSPHLLPSSRSSVTSQPLQHGPSSTTPPSCRKLFDEDDNCHAQIGPKNLMTAFDHADSDDD